MKLKHALIGLVAGLLVGVMFVAPMIPIMPAIAQDILEWPGNLIIRPFNALIYADGGIAFQNKSGTRAALIGWQFGPSVPTISACGTSTATGTDSMFTVVITGGTPATCAYTYAVTWPSAPKCWYMDETTANANGGKCVATTTTVTITLPTFTGAAANLATDTVTIFSQRKI